MKKFYLAKYKINYADEFDVCGMRLYTQEELDLLKVYQQTILSLEKEEKLWFNLQEDGIYFGTNEAFRFNSINEVISTIKMEEITKDEYDVLTKLELSSFGNQAIFDFFEDICEEEKDKIST